MQFSSRKRLAKVDQDKFDFMFKNDGTSTQGVVKMETQFATVTDPGDTNTITPPADTPAFICSITTAGAETRVLGAPDHVGQRAYIQLAVDGGDLTMTNASGWLDGGASDDVVTFGDAGDSMIVEAHGTAATDWRVTSEKGVAFA